MQSFHPPPQLRKASQHVLPLKPLVQIRTNERIVRKMGVRTTDTIDFRRLAGAEGLVSVQAPRTPHEPLPTQHLLNSRNTTGEAIRRVEEGGVGIGHLHAALKERRRHLTGNGGGVTVVEQPDRALCPNSPLTEQTTDDATLDRAFVDGRT